MRQRITFIQDPSESVDPNKLTVTSDSISTPELVAAREERITFGLDELPQELYKVLKASHELHIRWAGEKVFATRAPLVARLSPGLHVFYTPSRSNGSSEHLCPLLKKVFGDLDCVNPAASFTNLPRDRFSHSAAMQYYSPLPTLLDFTSYLTHKLCLSRFASSDPSCRPRVQALLSATSLDLSFDSISNALILSAIFPPRSQPLSLSRPVSLPSSRMEVGILSIEKAREKEELSLGGFLTVLGESSKPAPTLFSFPARHHPLPLSQTFTAAFLLPTGLHPTLQLDITSSSTPPLDDGACALHAHLTLPRTLFVDKYQLADPLFLASKNLAALHYITSAVDLEAPAYTLSQWGSSVLLSLSPPSSSSAAAAEPESWTSQIPMHLRYLPPASNASGLAAVSIPYPVLFWACTADEETKFAGNPFDRVHLGYDALFGPKTLFYHFSPSAPSTGGEGVGGEEAEARLVSHLSVPVLDLDRSGYVEGATAAGVALGFAWVCWCLLKVWRGAGYGSGSEDRSTVKEIGEGRKTK